MSAARQGDVRCVMQSSQTDAMGSCVAVPKAMNPMPSPVPPTPHTRTLRSIFAAVDVDSNGHLTGSECSVVGMESDSSPMDVQSFVRMQKQSWSESDDVEVGENIAALQERAKMYRDLSLSV